MGEVYRARDRRLDREVALKFLSAGFSSHPLFLERFRLEAWAASALNHPHICTVYDIGETDGQRFIVMELLRGSTLASRIQRRPLPLQELLEFGIEIAGALAAAHDHGIVHRDIKAGNIFLVDRPGELPLAKILDFGLAKLAGELPGAGTAFGTLAYMSPEQTQGLEVDARSDLFSFGVVLYEMATGVSPFADAAHARTREAILHQTPRPASQLNPGLPAGLDPMISKALEKNPDVRYQTAGELRADLKRLRPKRMLAPCLRVARVGRSTPDVGYTGW
jgi:serine/threonine protein kinase